MRFRTVVVEVAPTPSDRPWLLCLALWYTRSYGLVICERRHHLTVKRQALGLGGDPGHGRQRRHFPRFSNASNLVLCPSPATQVGYPIRQRASVKLHCCGCSFMDHAQACVCGRVVGACAVSSPPGHAHPGPAACVLPYAGLGAGVCCPSPGRPGLRSLISIPRGCSRVCLSKGLLGTSRLPCLPFGSWGL